MRRAGLSASAELLVILRLQHLSNKLF